MNARTRLSPSEFAELQRRRQASAEAAARGRAHRALPLDVVEARERAKRMPWPAQPEAMPTEAASAVSELLRDPSPPPPPPYPWRDLAVGAVVTLIAVSAAHVISRLFVAAIEVAAR
jgi:hypothetical protein